MASCGDVDCSKFDSKQAKWFKISEDGLTNGKWAQATDAFVGKPSMSKVPATLAPGNYLVMHQLISLHIADKPKGAEFYSSCSQLKVTGNETGAPSANELVSLPGAYSDTDKGILVNAFDSGLKYDFPGPPIAKLAATATDPVNNGGDEPEEPTKSTASSKPKPTTGGSCKKTKRDAEYKPRHISRVMRDIAGDLTSNQH